MSQPNVLRLPRKGWGEGKARKGPGYAATKGERESDGWRGGEGATQPSASERPGETESLLPLSISVTPPMPKGNATGSLSSPRCEKREGAHPRACRGFPPPSVRAARAPHPRRQWETRLESVARREHGSFLDVRVLHQLLDRPGPLRRRHGELLAHGDGAVVDGEAHAHDDVLGLGGVAWKSG